jgi:hypothetical protein
MEHFIYNCDVCNYSSTNKAKYKEHCTTIKHLQNTGECEEQKKSKWQCKNCGKKYSYQTGLCRHKNNCTKHIIQSNSQQQIQGLTAEDLKTIMFEMFDVIKQTNSNNNNNTINNHNNGTINNNNNNHFNLNFFLNEQCKDAMDINEFINSIEVSLHDLEETGRLGYAEGISRIIVNNLKQLDIHKRPIHCSDTKRNVLYIRNLMQWIKDNEDHKLMKKIIDRVSMKNIAKISDWKNANPGCDAYDSRKRSTYLTIVQNAMTGGTEEQQITNTKKVISNISMETSINKDRLNNLV